jgi:urease accessory protein UreH
VIPSEVVDIADLLAPGWAEEDEEFQCEVLAAAWRIYNAGYRREVSL